MSTIRFPATSLLAAVCAAAVAACGGAPSAGQACAPVQAIGPDGQQLDLSGTWSGNDGGVYHIKQIDNCVWWSGVSNFPGQYPGQEWIMTFKGTISSEGVIVGDFVDVKGTNPGNGTLTIEARVDQAEGQGSVVNLYRTAATGHEIGVTFWQRDTGQPSSEPPPAEPVPAESPPATT